MNTQEEFNKRTRNVITILLTLHLILLILLITLSVKYNVPITNHNNFVDTIPEDILTALKMFNEWLFIITLIIMFIIAITLIGGETYEQTTKQ